MTTTLEVVESEQDVENKSNATTAPFWSGGRKSLHMKLVKSEAVAGESSWSVLAVETANHNRVVFQASIRNEQWAALIEAMENGRYKAVEVSNANWNEPRVKPADDVGLPGPDGNVVIIRDPGPVDAQAVNARIFRVELEATGS